MTIKEAKTTVNSIDENTWYALSAIVPPDKLIYIKNFWAGLIKHSQEKGDDISSEELSALAKKYFGSKILEINWAGDTSDIVSGLLEYFKIPDEARLYVTNFVTLFFDKGVKDE